MCAMCCGPCVVGRVLCAVCCGPCVVWCTWWAVCCVVCRVQCAMCGGPCAVCRGPCAVCCVPCAVCRVLWVMCCVPGAVCSGPGAVGRVPCAVPCVVGRVLCRVPCALWCVACGVCPVPCAVPGAVPLCSSSVSGLITATVDCMGKIFWISCVAISRDSEPCSGFIGLSSTWNCARKLSRTQRKFNHYVRVEPTYTVIGMLAILQIFILNELQQTFQGVPLKQSGVLWVQAAPSSPPQHLPVQDTMPSWGH